MWIRQLWLTAQNYWTYWFFIWIRHGRTTSEIFQNPTRRNIKPKREHRRICRLHSWISNDAYVANSCMPTPILRDISDQMCIHQVWMVHLLPIESIAFLFYSQLLLLNGVPYFHGRIGLYALGYLDGPIAPGSIIFWDTSHSNYYIKLIEASSTCRPILVIFGSKAVTLLLKESFIRTQKSVFATLLCYFMLLQSRCIDLACK